MELVFGADLDNILYDRDAAEEHVNKNGSLYDITRIEDLMLFKADFEEAKKVYLKESEIVYGADESLTENGILKGIIYCILSSFQNYTGHILGFKCILDKNKEISDIVYDKERISEVLKESGIMFHNQKAGYVYELVDTWDGSNMLHIIRDGIKNSREDEIALRKNVISEVKGLGEKTASLFLRMCGAEFLVPVDSWMAEMLYFYGYPCEMPRTNVDRIRWGTDNIISTKQRKKGLDGKKYIKAEAFALDLAGKYDVSGYLLQLAFWAKKSTYNINK